MTLRHRLLPTPTSTGSLDSESLDPWFDPDPLDLEPNEEGRRVREVVRPVTSVEPRREVGEVV